MNTHKQSVMSTGFAVFLALAIAALDAGLLHVGDDVFVGSTLSAQTSAGPADDDACNTGENGAISRTCIPLIQPLGTSNTIALRPGAQTFIQYFNDASDLLLTISVGFAVLWILIGCYFIMISGSDGGKRSTGKSIITWALIGLIIVNFAGFFLRTLNNIFFT